MPKKTEVPNSREAESGVLGSILIDPSKVGEVDQILKPEDFYEPRHEVLFSTIREMFLNNKKIDMLTLSNQLNENKRLREVGGRTYLAELTELVPTSSHAVAYAEIVKKKSTMRKVLEKSESISSIASSDSDTALDETEKGLIETIEVIQQQRELKERESFDDALMGVLEEIEENKYHGIPTGVPQIDEITLKLKSGHFWIIGADTNVGKTQFALMIVRNILLEKTDNKIIFYSLEMTQRDIAARLYFLEKNFTLNNSEAIDKVHKMSKKLSIYTTKLRLDQIESHLLSLKEKPKIAFIDFLQNIETEDRDEYQRMTNIARRIQLLALRTGVCIVGISQMSIDQARRKEESSINFKGSGALSDACNVGIKLYIKDDTGNKHVPFYCWVGKNRHGRKALIEFEFDKERNMIVFDNVYVKKSDKEDVKVPLPKIANE